jgi:hypothetical protein
MYTPWGQSDGQTTLAKGIISYTTPGHGGIHVEAELNKLIHEVWRSDEGWYEEDCEWAKVAFHFPLAFSAKERESAINTLKNWDPYKYMQVTGETLKPEDSMYIREDNWKREHDNHLQVICACGDWHVGVPDGMVYVTMIRGNKLNHQNNHHDKSDERYFLVPEADYKLPFAIVDEKKYQEIKELAWGMKETVKSK